jgi:hypothetical protein
MGAANTLHCRLFSKTAGTESSVSFTSMNVTSAGGEAWVIDYRKASGTVTSAGTEKDSTASATAFAPTTIATNAAATEIEFVVNRSASSISLGSGSFASRGTSNVTPVGGTTVTLGVADDVVASASTPAAATWNGVNAAWNGSVVAYK